jgi:hypothetical protein
MPGRPARLRNGIDRRHGRHDHPEDHVVGEGGRWKVIPPGRPRAGSSRTAGIGYRAAYVRPVPAGPVCPGMNTRRRGRLDLEPTRPGPSSSTVAVRSTGRAPALEGGRKGVEFHRMASVLAFVRTLRAALLLQRRLD